MNAESTSPAMQQGWRRVVLGKRPLWTLLRILALVLTTFILLKFVFYPIRVTGISMEPTYFDGTINLINRLAYHKAPPERGDVVLIRRSQKEYLLKRIVGLPGERVGFWEGTLYVNRKPMDEPYVKRRQPWIVAPELLGADEYYVVGDNRGMHPRNHAFGIIKKEQILGKVVF